MDNFTQAINYNTILITLRKADSYAMQVFSGCEEYNPARYAELCNVTEEEIEDNHDIVVRTFNNLPRDVKIISRNDIIWPPEVKDVPFLYLRGNEGLLATDGVSIVGSRHPSDRGKELARQAAGVLGDYGYTVVSGLAVGIDGVAHIQALADDRPTIAVIGTPVDTCYPPEHEKLQELIAENGLVVSMFSPCLPVQKYYFMQRNLLMSRISCASIVVESNDGGGGVSQAKYTERQGRKVIIFREVYENRTWLWPRSFKNPSIIANAGEIPGVLRGTAGKGRTPAAADARPEQPELFDLY